MMKPKEILKYFSDREIEIINEIREIVDIESPTFDQQKSTKIADWLQSKVSEIDGDIKIERYPFEGVGEHVIIRAFQAEEKNIFLLGHTDTVHPIGTYNPTRIEGEKMFGNGIFDMKANVVLIFAVLKFLKESGIKPVRPLTILLSCDEETGSKTGRAFVEKEAKNAEFCLVLEPSANGKVKTGRKGTGMYVVKTHGIPAHAGLEPEKGASAILEIAHQIEKIHQLNDPDEGTTANVCVIKGGTTSNVIPEDAECSVDTRFSTLAEAYRLDNELKMLKPYDERLKIEVIGGINRPPLERSKDVVELFEKAKDLAATLDYSLGETQVGGASDGNFVAAMGIPVIDGFGIAGDGAHTLDEHILVDDIHRRAALLTLMLIS